MLLPLTTLEGIERGRLFQKEDVQVLIFDRRINFIEGKSNYFNSCYIGKDFFGNRNGITFERLEIKK